MSLKDVRKGARPRVLADRMGRHVSTPEPNISGQHHRQPGLRCGNTDGAKLRVGAEIK